MIQQNETINVDSSTTWATNEWQFCANRLPCGICRLMQCFCPLTCALRDVTWKNPSEVTCKTEVQDGEM